MEAEGAVRIYLRSEEKRELRYMPYVGDGDSKGYARVQYAKPYGSAVEIEKEECIAHVIKRMGSNLRVTVQKYKGKPNILNYEKNCTGSLVLEKSTREILTLNDCL